MKCICGHSMRSHASSKYGNSPRTYGSCRICSCTQYMTLEDVKKLEEYYKALLKSRDKEICELKSKLKTFEEATSNA